ncbi:hypothetical protein FC99_GL002420 [Levilactobacillus koreensis JCM 16448]|nr:hypothetical protein FC99_GL002420 [Levilactobacillus koreensis JCM 16448]
MYFGNKGDKAADGMAFVLQNSSAGIKSLGAAGEGLGVWGNDGNGDPQSDVSGITYGAIDNSWALEFDTRPNVSEDSLGGADSFDLGKIAKYPGTVFSEISEEKVVRNGMHIASGYPKSAETYSDSYYKRQWIKDPNNPNRGKWNGPGKLYKMNHVRPKSAGNLADGKWHHLSLAWSATNKTMTYTLNDIDPNNKKKQSIDDIITDTLKINVNIPGENNLNALDKLSKASGIKLNESTRDGAASIKTDPDGNVYWGVTGATNAYSSENGLVVVDSATSLGHVESSATLTKKTSQTSQNEEKISEGDSVTSGDQVTYTYTFDYQGNSQQDIHPLTMDVPLPTPLKWQSGGVSYGNESILSEPFSTDELTHTQIQKTWTQSLNGTNPKAIVKVTGIVPKVTSPVKVAAVTARFFGDNYQTKLSLPSYNIQSKKQMDLKLTADKTSFELKHSDSATITGSLTDNDQPIPAEEMKDYHLNALLNGKATTSGSLDSTGHFNFNIAPKDLKVGDNQLVLVGADDVDAADDDRSHRSNAVTITIKREEGTLYISKVAENSTFIPTQLTGRPQWISRQNDWQLKVMDERGANSKWTLQVSLGTPFHLKDGSGLMTGDVALRHGHDQDEVLKNDAVNVMSKTTTTEDEETDVLPSHWNEVEGLALHVNGGAVAGDYEGTFDWQLVDGPQAD